MSGTQPTTTTVSPSSEWRTPAGAVAIFSQTLLLAGLGIACYLKNENAIMMVLGAIVVNGTTTVNFYMGSSKSSQTKDATIATQLPVPVPPAGSTTVTSTPATTTVITPTETTTRTEHTPPIVVQQGAPTPPIVVSSGTITTGGTTTP